MKFYEHIHENMLQVCVGISSLHFDKETTHIQTQIAPCNSVQSVFEKVT